MTQPAELKAGLLTVVCCCLFLVACAEETPGPQFANEPRPSRTPTVASLPSTPQAQATPISMATPASIGELMMTRGAAPRVFVASGDTIWAVESDGQARRVFEAPEGSRILTIDSAPGAQRVAALLGPDSQARGDTSRELVLLDQDGQNAIRISEFGADGATPAPTTGRGADLIDWSPQGGRLLVALRDGRLFDVQPDEEATPAPLQIKVDGKHVVAPSWSPTGETIGFVAVSDDLHDRSLHIFDVKSGSVSDVVLPPEGRFIVDFTWMPDGVSLLFTEGGDLGGAVSGIDLWLVDAEGANRALLASAGSVAPVAQIFNMRPSPDGRSVAYAVRVPGDEAPRVDSVWVRDIASGRGFRISLPSINSLEDVWWTDAGLIVSVTTDGSGAQRQPMYALLQVKRDGAVSAIWAAPIGTPAAGASPVATPVATPRTS